jgi:DNA-binding Lrp family transcriptional regulator
LLVLVVGKNNHEIANFVSQKLSHIDGVKATNTQFILKRYKEDGEIIEGKEEVRRQPVVF